MLEFFFDCSSPWTWLAFHNVQPLAADLGVAIQWRPVLVGGIFNSVNPSVYEQREKPVPAKRDYMLKDLQDWAREAGLKINFPPKVFPVNSVKAMRACIWIEQTQGADAMVAFAAEVFRSYWSDDLDISQDDVLRGICERSGQAPSAVLAAMALPAIKEQLKLNTEEVIRRGGYGSPTMFVNGTDMYFGNDRLPLVRSALLRLRG